MEPALFNTIEDILPVLDEGVAIDFRCMIPVAVFNFSNRRRSRYGIYVRNFIGVDFANKPRTTTELEEQKICIVHEFLHAYNHFVGRRMPGNKKAHKIAEDAIDRHAYTFLDNEPFFERLLMEMLFRRNCKVIFHKSIWANGMRGCPFHPYYFALLEKFKQRLILAPPV